MIVVHRTRGDMSFFKFFAHTVVISRKTVKLGKNTNCDICAHNSWRYDFCDIFSHTVVLSNKTVKSGKDAICDTCAQNSRNNEFCKIFCSSSCNKL